MKRTTFVTAVILLVSCLLLAGCPSPADPAKGGVETRFVTILAGTFNMGCTGGDFDENVHSVTLTRNILMCDHEVTQGEYTTYCTYTGSKSPSSTYGDGDDYPAYYVSWYDALVYCNKRSMAEGLTPCYTINGSTDPSVWGTVPTSSNSTWDSATCDFDADGYRLPTEAEWEYAARAGDTTTGSRTWSGTSDSSSLGNYAWYYDNSSRKTHTVKGKAANAWGLYDMSGNVREWCWDWYGSNYYSSSAANDPTGPSSGSYRVRRGGGWNIRADFCSVANRNYDLPNCRDGNCPDIRSCFIGLRVVRSSSN